MCRWLAYSGSPVNLEELLYKPANSLVMQSKHSRLGATTTNGAQAIYQVLVLIPLGGLLVVVLRNVIGFPTFGTFMPILIALAFRETQLLWGIVLFTFIVGRASRSGGSSSA